MPSDGAFHSGSAFFFFSTLPYFEQRFRNFTRNYFILGNFFIPILNTVYWSRGYFHDSSLHRSTLTMTLPGKMSMMTETLILGEEA